MSFWRLRQGRHGDAHHGQTVEEVAAQQALVHGPQGMLVEDADDAHVDGDLRMGAQTAHALFLDDAQQFGLQAQGHGVELVEEQGAAVGLFEQAGLVRGVGVGALDRTEQDAFQQVFRDGGAVDRDERMPGAAAGRVDGLGNSSLPVPLSPQIMTGEELVAAERASWMHSCRASSRPTMLEKV